MRQRGLLVMVLGCALACSAVREPPPTAHGDSAFVAPASATAFNQFAIDTARRLISEYFEGQVLHARGEWPQMDICYRNPAVRITRTPTAVARARVLTVAPIGPSRPYRPDSLSVTAELLVVARATERGTAWNIAPSVDLDTVQLTMSPAKSGGRIDWSLCWDKHSIPEFDGEPALLRTVDSNAIGDVHWTPPLGSWASLARLADSLRWSSMVTLADDSAVVRVERSGGFNDRIGVLQEARDGQQCLTIADSSLPPGTPVLLVPPGAPEATRHALVEGRRRNPCRAPGDEGGSVSLVGESYYDVVVPPGDSTGDNVIAVVGRPNALRRAGGRVTIDTDGDGRPEKFAQCTSQEGVHLLVSTDSAGQWVKRWEGYVYVPYDLEPDC